MVPEILFNSPPRNLELVDGESHIFCASLDLPVSRLDQLEALLSKPERLRANRFVFGRDRNHFVAGRGLLREILGRLLHVDPAQLGFTYGINGKPRLAAPVDGRILQFNLAHADSLAVYIIAGRGDVGIDVELVRPICEIQNIMAQFASARENTEWRSLPASRRLEAFFECWTRKEALVKAVGGSLGEQPDQFKFPPLDGSGRLQFGFVKTATGISTFSLEILTPACGYMAAAAFKGAGLPQCWGWPPR